MMSGVEAEGYTKVVHKKYNKAFYEFEDARIPNANVRFSEKFVIPADHTGDYTITTIVIPAGQQLRLIYLNFFAVGEGLGMDPVLLIEQAGGTSHALPEGKVDAIKAPDQKRGTYENPIHILEGTVTFKIQSPVVAYEGLELALSFWGDSNAPQIDP